MSAPAARRRFRPASGPLTPALMALVVTLTGACSDEPSSGPGGGPAPATQATAPAAPAERSWFEPVEAELAAMRCGRPECPTILEVNGGGVALFDADDDGDLELLLVIPGDYPATGAATGRSNRLYRNDGGRLVDVTAGSGVDVEGYCNGVAVGDYDADGRRDLYLTRRGTGVLLRNLGGCRFESVPEAAGAAGTPDDWGTSASFVDVDRDGDADLFVANYLLLDPDHPPLNGQDGRSCLWKGMPVMCGPQGLPPQSSRYYRNEGGRFVEATQEAGFDASPAYGLGVIDGDWNADGWPDLFVANDSVPNHLFLSQGDGRVAEAGVLSGAALSAQGRELAGMGVAAGDADGDADEELFMTSFSGEPSAYYVNEGGGRFRDRSDPAGLGGPTRPTLGWGTDFLDADLDGDLDLVSSNGHVYPQADEPGTGTSWAQRPLLFLNEGAGRYRAAEWPGAEPVVGRALAVGDLDDDGALDLVQTRLSGPPRVWRGTADGTRAVRVVVRGPPGNPDGCGTVLTLSDAQGTRTGRVRTAGGFQAANDPRVVFAFRSPGRLLATLPDGSTRELEVAGPGLLVVEAGTP
jgi:hypothetical protein